MKLKLSFTLDAIIYNVVRFFPFFYVAFSKTVYVATIKGERYGPMLSYGLHCCLVAWLQFKFCLNTVFTGRIKKGLVISPV